MARTLKVGGFILRDLRHVVLSQRNHRRGNKLQFRDINRIEWAVLHCTGTRDRPGETDGFSGDDLWAIRDYTLGPNHISTIGCYVFPYHFFIDTVEGKTTITWAVPAKVKTWQVHKLNTKCIGVSMVDPGDPNQAPSKNKLEAAEWTLALLCAAFNKTPEEFVKLHRELQRTKDCPGLAVTRENVIVGVMDKLERGTRSGTIQKILERVDILGDAGLLRGEI